MYKTDFILKTGLDLSARQFESTRNPVGVVTDFFLLCRLLITFANSLDPDQARQNVGPDLDLNCLTL